MPHHPKTNILWAYKLAKNIKWKLHAKYLSAKYVKFSLKLVWLDNGNFHKNTNFNNIGYF